MRIHAVRVLLGASGLRRQRVQLGCICKRIGLGHFSFGYSERIVCRSKLERCCR